MDKHLNSRDRLIYRIFIIGKIIQQMNKFNKWNDFYFFLDAKWSKFVYISVEKDENRFVIKYT